MLKNAYLPLQPLHLPAQYSPGSQPWNTMRSTLVILHMLIYPSNLKFTLFQPLLFSKRGLNFFLQKNLPCVMRNHFTEPVRLIALLSAPSPLQMLSFLRAEVVPN